MNFGTAQFAATAGAAIGGIVGGFLSISISGRKTAHIDPMGEKGGPVIMYYTAAGAALGALLFGGLAAQTCPAVAQPAIGATGLSPIVAYVPSAAPCGPHETRNAAGICVPAVP